MFTHLFGFSLIDNQLLSSSSLSFISLHDDVVCNQSTPVLDFEKKPLNQWTADELQQWLKRGEFSDRAENFKKINGRKASNLKELTIQQIIKDDLMGALLYLDIQELKNRVIIGMI